MRRVVCFRFFCLLNSSDNDYSIQWGDDVNELKAKVKNQIEEIAKQWTREGRDNCVNATAGAFKGGGAINGYLYGGSPH